MERIPLARRHLLGSVFLASGAALLVYIVSGVSLPAALALVLAVAAAVSAVVWRGPGHSQARRPRGIDRGRRRYRCVRPLALSHHRGGGAHLLTVRHDATDRLGRITGIPTLVMSAAHDPIAPPRHGLALANAIPGARYVEFADASHGLPIQHAAKVNALLLTHLPRAEERAVANAGGGGVHATSPGATPSGTAAEP
jgi:pimeloyl-ACP methyl ester carboxylesterase